MNEITGDDPFCINYLFFAITDHGRIRTCEFSKGFDRLGGLIILNEPDQPVGTDDEGNERHLGVTGMAAGNESNTERQERRHDEEIDERVAELRDEQIENRCPLSVVDIVRAVLR